MKELLGKKVEFKQEWKGIRVKDKVTVIDIKHKNHFGKTYFVGHITPDNFYCLLENQYDFFSKCYMGFCQVIKLTNTEQ